MLAFELDKLPAINSWRASSFSAIIGFGSRPDRRSPTVCSPTPALRPAMGIMCGTTFFFFRTIYNSLQEAGKTWAVYYADDNDVAKFSQVVARAYTKPSDEANWQADQATGA